MSIIKNYNSQKKCLKNTKTTNIARIDELSGGLVQLDTRVKGERLVTEIYLLISGIKFAYAIGQEVLYNNKVEHIAFIGSIGTVVFMSQLAQDTSITIKGKLANLRRDKIEKDITKLVNFPRDKIVTLKNGQQLTVDKIYSHGTFKAKNGKFYDKSLLK